MPVAHLEDRAVVAVSGAEARSFLQGLITNDIERLCPGKGIYAALLTPQGKILFDFFLVEGDGALLIDCQATARDALVKRLSMYKLRARVTIEPREQLAVLAEWNAEEAAHAISYPDPRVASLGRRAVIAQGEMPANLAHADAYHAHRLSLGVPEAADFGSDRMFALDADLDELRAIDFAKGCYVGQELTARMKHRGTARKRLLLLQWSGPGVPATDMPVLAGGKAIGEIASVHGRHGFALVRLDRLDEAGDAPVSAGSSAVELIKPPWLFP
jgi:folate-binding protein YgfZ